MFISLLSDIHLCFYCKETNPSDKMQRQIQEFLRMSGISKIPEEQRDIMIIPGDLSHYNLLTQEFLKVLKSMFKYVIITAGNHDLYLTSNSQKQKYMFSSYNRKLELKRWCKDNNIIYLDGDIVSIEGYNFAGTGMFWDKFYYEFLEGSEVSDTVVLEFYKNVMNDLNYMIHGEDVYNIPLAYGGRFKKTSFDPYKYFADEYQKLQRFNDFDNIDVMVTHYSPVIPEGMPLYYAQDRSTTFYMFDGEKDVQRIQAKYWLFGHTHRRYDFEKFGTRFLCQPLGYPGETPYMVRTIEI